MSEFKEAKTAIKSKAWTLIEKVEIANAICSDLRFSHAEARAAVTMVLYFHNSTSGDLFPSRKQIMERSCVHKDTIIYATRKMRRLGYLTYEQSTGGFQKRNSYYLNKRSEIPTLLDTKNGRKNQLHGSIKSTPNGSEKSTPIYPENLSQEGSGSPSPCDGKASPSQEGLQRGPVDEPVMPSEAEREAHVAAVEKRIGRKIPNTMP